MQVKDFVLPELVGKADNGDLSVGGCVDDTQLKQVFVLAEVEEEHREFAALGLAEQHLEERRYKDFLKRKVKEGLFVEELACGCRVVHKRKRISAPGGSKRNNVVEPRWCVRRIALLTAESQVGAWIVQRIRITSFSGRLTAVFGIAVAAVRPSSASSLESTWGSGRSWRS